ncbi:MAG TPA: (2Fe-2S)-binding protein [Aeromonadales bacterium]|nr:(2Fe-2S)-binding protein [Aeromonadales bacterium]
MKLTVNDKQVAITAEADMPLLWVLRDLLSLTGTKFGCGGGYCGACTVHVDGKPVRSCLLPVSAAEGKKITTIEGLSKDNNHPLQQAWKEQIVPQCGYCQSGQLMSAAALLAQNKKPTDDDIDTAMSGNLCRCGTYPRIKKAITEAAKKMTVKNVGEHS